MSLKTLPRYAAPAVGEQHHDDGVGGKVFRGLERDAHRETRRAADKQALLAREATGDLERLGVARRDDLVDDGGVVGGRPEVFADSLDEVRAPGTAGVADPSGSAPMDADAGFCSLR